MRSVLRRVACSTISKRAAASPMALCSAAAPRPLLAAAGRLLHGRAACLSSAGTGSSGVGRGAHSALLTSEQRIEHELSLSNARREERARRMQELAELEEQLHAHRMAEVMSPGWYLRMHWSKYGPILAAVLCAAASMLTSYHLWKQTHHYTLDRASLQGELASLQAQREAVARRKQVEMADAQRILDAYARTQTALVATASAGPDAAASAASPSASALRTYRASKADVAKLRQLQGELQQAYAAP